MSGEKNRLHKILAEAGIRLHALVTALHGKTARAMIKAIMKALPVETIVATAVSLRADRKELEEALQTGHGVRHTDVLEKILQPMPGIDAPGAGWQ